MLTIQLNQNLTQYVAIYNPQDDWWYLNGQRYRKAYLQSLEVFKNGTFGVPCTNGVYHHSGGSNIGLATITTESIIFAQPASNTYTPIITNDMIDLSKYQKATVVTDRGNIELNLSNISQDGYLCVFRAPNGSLYVLVTNTKENYYTNRINQDVPSVNTGGGIVVYSIILE